MSILPQAANATSLQFKQDETNHILVPADANTASTLWQGYHCTIGSAAYISAGVDKAGNDQYRRIMFPTVPATGV